MQAKLPSVVKIIPDPDSCPLRLDVCLSESIEGLSRNQIKQIIQSRAVTVNGKSAKPSLLLKGGEAIEATLPDPPETEIIPEPIPLDILYEDEDILIINKPADIIVHPGAGVRSGTLVHGLRHYTDQLSTLGGRLRPGIVHRLDRQTSGCLAVARTDRAHAILTQQLMERTMGREYLAWVVGWMDGPSGDIEAPIGRSSRNRTQMAVQGKTGRPARTHWQTLARAPGLSLLACKLETGRTHQIRVHLAHVHRPVLGDPVYGFAPKEAAQRVPPGHGKILQAMARCKRQMLHAARLRLLHPRSGRLIEVEAPLPPDFTELNAALEPWVEMTLSETDHSITIGNPNKRSTD